MNNARQEPPDLEVAEYRAAGEAHYIRQSHERSGEREAFMVRALLTAIFALAREVRALRLRE